MEIGIRQPPCARDLGFDKFAAWAADVGFDAIDVPRLTPEVKQALDANGLRCGTVDLPNWGGMLSPDEGEQKAALEEQKKLLAQDAELGAKVVFAVLLPKDPMQPRKKTFEIWKKSFPPLMSWLEANDLQFAIEFWFGPSPMHPSLGCTPETLRPMFAEVDSPNHGVCYDPSHLLRADIDHVRFLWEFGSRVKHVHGKDTELSEDDLYECGNLGSTFGGKYGYGDRAWRYCIPGEGTVDWVAISRRLRDVGYDNLICVELEDHYYFPSVEQQQEGMTRALEHLQAAQL
jgi:sugar phosphate isomerase/epimerase